jgi:leucyl aminopeptidase (aminopeptidase T)
MQFRYYLQPGFTNLREIDLIEAAKVVVDQCLKVQPGENVVIVTDTMQSWRLVESVAMAVNLAKAEYTLICTKPRKSMYGPKEITEPPAPVAGALKKADAAFLVGTTGLVFTSAVQEALDNGTRLLSSPGMSEDNFVRCVMTDHEELWEITKRVQSFFTNGRHCKLTSPQGTDLKFEIAFHPLGDRSGIPKPGTFDFLPAGIASAGFKKGTANGTIVIDGSFSRIGVLREPLTLTVQNGTIVKSEGGFEVREFRNMMDMFGDPNMYNPGIITTGTNPNAKFTGVPNEDERVIGMCSIMIGDNAKTQGGDNPAVMYLVAMLTTPRLEIDGTVIVEEGRLRV